VEQVEEIDEEKLALIEQKKQLRIEIAAIEAEKAQLLEEITVRKDEANRIIDEVNEQAAQVVAGVEKEREAVMEFRRTEEERITREAVKVKEDASSQGFKEGREEGREVVAGKAINLLKNLESILSQAVQEKDGVILEAEHQILELAIAISRKIVRTEITINPAVIEETLKQALAKVTDRDTITLYLNTTDVELVTKRRSEILKKLDPGSRVNIIEDENIEPGGLVITTNLGNIDATISGQELEIDRFLKQIHEQNQQET
jgi:flagellar assembly protein FliH